MNNPQSKSYLGDAVYAEYDDYGIWLTTEDGMQTTNEIYLEPEVLLNLLRFAEHRQLTTRPKEES